MVSNAKDDFPEPDSPVNTISLSRGKSTLTFFRLCSRAPCTTKRSTVIPLASLLFCSLRCSWHSPDPGSVGMARASSFGPAEPHHSSSLRCSWHSPHPVLAYGSRPDPSVLSSPLRPLALLPATRSAILSVGHARPHSLALHYNHCLTGAVTYPIYLTSSNMRSSWRNVRGRRRPKLRRSARPSGLRVAHRQMAIVLRRFGANWPELQAHRTRPADRD